MQSATIDEPSSQPKDESKEVSKRAENFSLHTHAESSEADAPITLFLLKQLRVQIRAQDGTIQDVKLRGGESGIRLLILAFIAWRMGDPVDKDKMLTYALSRGKRREMNTDQLGEVFDAAKKHLRRDLDRAVHELERAGHPVDTEIDLDFFSNESGFYWLHPSCSVADLAAIENAYQKLLAARKEGLLDEKVDGSVPPWALDACQQLLAAYTGDFLQELLEKVPDEFGSWVREPVTLYRDRYLDALHVLATHESALGRQAFDEDLSPEHNEEQRRQHSARAAQLFYDYAISAINSIWDRKLKFAYRAGKDGERVIMSARAIRRCVVELGKLGKSDTIDQVYLAYKERMAKLSEGNWKPDTDTERDVADAKTTTSAYRFSSQIAVMQQGQHTR